MEQAGYDYSTPPMSEFGQNRKSRPCGGMSCFAPVERTSSGYPRISEKCQRRTHALLNHVVGAGEKRRRDSEADRLGGFQIDGQFVSVGLLNR